MKNLIHFSRRIQMIRLTNDQIDQKIQYIQDYKIAQNADWDEKILAAELKALVQTLAAKVNGGKLSAAEE